MNAELNILVIIFNNGNAAVRTYIPPAKKALELYLQLKYLADNSREQKRLICSHAFLPYQSPKKPTLSPGTLSHSELALLLLHCIAKKESKNQSTKGLQ